MPSSTRASPSSSRSRSVNALSSSWSADRPRLAEVVLGALDPPSRHRDSSRVRLSTVAPGDAQDHRVDRFGSDRQVRMLATSVGTGLAADVGRARCDPEALAGDDVRDAQRERERIAGLRDAACAPSRLGPRLASPPSSVPANEAVDRVVVLGLMIARRYQVPRTRRSRPGSGLARDEHLAAPAGTSRRRRIRRSVHGPANGVVSDAPRRPRRRLRAGRRRGSRSVRPTGPHLGIKPPSARAGGLRRESSSPSPSAPG